jgi:hypothetical protein
MPEVFKFQLGCCCEARLCNVVFDNAFNSTVDESAMSACPGGPWYDDNGDPTDLNPLWWTLVSGAGALCVDSHGHATPSTHAPCGGGTGGQSTVKIDAVNPYQTILLNSTSLQKSSFRIMADFYPRHGGDTLQVFIDYKDDCNHTVVEFIANDHHPEVGVYRVVNGVRTKLYRRMNVSGRDTGGGVFTNEGFYFNLATVPCPSITLNISLARSTLLVRVTGGERAGSDGTSPNGAATAFGSLNYDFDWSGTHNNPESLGGGYPDPSDNIGYRPLLISVGSETGGAYNMTRARWGVGGIVGPTGDYFEIGEVRAWNTDVLLARDNVLGVDCGGGGLSCAPDYICNGLLTMYPDQISVHSEGIVCGPHARQWLSCGDLSTQYTDCDTTLSAPWTLQTEIFCTNFNADFVVDWTPYNFGGTRHLCEYYTGHTASISTYNPRYGRSNPDPCGAGVFSDLVDGHEGEVLLNGITAGYGVGNGLVPAVELLLLQYPTGNDLPAFWKPADVIDKWMRNSGAPGYNEATTDCHWVHYSGADPITTSGQQMKLTAFTYALSD